MKRDLKVEINPEAWKDNSIFKENDNSMTTSKGMDKMKRYATILP